MTRQTRTPGRLSSTSYCVLSCGIGLMVPGCKGESSQTAAPPPKEAAPQEKITLPEYFGSYAIDAGKTIELKADGKAELSPKAEFIVFHKAIATGQGVQANRWIVRREFDHWRDRWNSVDVESRLKPVEGKPEMLRVVPTHELAPGMYSLAGDPPIPFFVELGRYKKNLMDSARAALAKNDAHAAVKDAANLYKVQSDAEVWDLRQEALIAFHIVEARNSIAGRKWDAATKHADSALAIRPGDGAARELLTKSIPFQQALETAKEAFANQNWDQAGVAADKALSLKPDDHEIQELQRGMGIIWTKLFEVALTDGRLLECEKHLLRIEAYYGNESDLRRRLLDALPPSPNRVFLPVAAGYGHAFGLKAYGAIVAWGDNSVGQTNVPAPNTGFIAIAAVWSHSLGLKADGSIVAWGANSDGESNVPAPNTGFIAVAGGRDHSLGLKGNGSIVAWGANRYGQTNVPAPNTGFIAVAGGGDHSLGLKADGSIVAWGKNWYGETNVPAPNTGFIAVAAGDDHNLGLKGDGSIVAWGANHYGQTNVPAPNTGFIAVAAGGCETCFVSGGHSLGLKRDGSIVAWGANRLGQTNVPAPNTDFVAVAASNYNSLGLKADGSIVAWGGNEYGQTNVPAPNTGFMTATVRE